MQRDVRGVGGGGADVHDDDGDDDDDDDSTNNKDQIYFDFTFGLYAVDY